MSFERPSQLTIYVCDNAVHQHKPLCDAIVHRAREAGLAGATVLRGIEGFGRDFVHRNDDLLHGRLVTLDQLEIYPPRRQVQTT